MDIDERIDNLISSLIHAAIKDNLEHVVKFRAALRAEFERLAARIDELEAAQAWIPVPITNPDDIPQTYEKVILFANNEYLFGWHSPILDKGLRWWSYANCDNTDSMPDEVFPTHIFRIHPPLPPPPAIDTTFKGEISDAKVFDHALSDAEIAEQYQSPPPPADVHT